MGARFFFFFLLYLYLKKKKKKGSRALVALPRALPWGVRVGNGPAPAPMECSSGGRSRGPI